MTRRGPVLASVALAVAALLAWALAGAGPDRAAEPPPGAAAAALIEGLLEGSEEDGFSRPTGPWSVSLPRDHGGHGDARAETWMIAAHLEDDRGQPVGVQVSLTRFGLKPALPPDAAPTWEIRALHRGYVAVAQAGATASRAEERFSRGAGAAGHDAAAREVWLDDWLLSYGGEPTAGDLTVAAGVGDMRVRLSLTPEKPPAPIGGDDAAPVRGFALPRLSVSGEISTGGSVTGVSGTAWIDRAWGELPPPGGPLAYDRLVLQLDDRTDLSLLRTRRRDGRGPTTVDGFLVAPSGGVETFSANAVEMTPTAYWTPDGAETGFPVEWRISGPGLTLRVAAVFEDQENASALAGWSGLVSAEGRLGDEPVSGLGTLQMTGYDGQ